MSGLKSIMPPEFNLTRGEAYNYYLSHKNISHETIIKNLVVNSSTPLKELSSIQADANLNEQFLSAIQVASNELTRFINLINQKNVSLRKATRDKKTIFRLSDFPALRKDWNGVLLKQTTLAGVQQQPQYLTAFDGGQYGAAMADVQMMSSDGVTFLMNKLYLVSASIMMKNIFDEIIPTLDDGAVVLIQTNIHSDELKYLVQFIMFGQIECDTECPNSCRADSILFELLKSFGINLHGNSITLYHSKKFGEPQKELIQIDQSDISTSVASDKTIHFKKELENSFEDESQDRLYSNNQYKTEMELVQPVDFTQYADKDIEYSKQDLLIPSCDTLSMPIAQHFPCMPNYTDLLTGIEMENMLRQGMEPFISNDGSLDSGESTGSSKQKGKLKRKRKLKSKKSSQDGISKKLKKKDPASQILQKSKISAKEQKPFMELSREGQKARVGEFFDQFLKESQVLGISDGSFAGYLGYRATIDGEPWVASTFKWLHEGIMADEKLKDNPDSKLLFTPTAATEPGDESVVKIIPPVQPQNTVIKPRPPFLDLSHEEKMAQVGDFFDVFLEKADQLQITSACFAAYLGMKVTYVTDRLAASTFSKLYDGSDKREKWRFSLGPKEVKCAACGKKFQGEKMTFLSIRLKGHMKTVHPSFDYKCIACGDAVETWEDHVKHCNDYHNGEMKMQCNSCPSIFNSRAEIRSHKLTHHTSSRPEIVCSECGKKLTPASMEVHMKTEHGQEHVKCPKCPKILKHPVALERHLKTNHDECQCEECGKVCNSATGLKRHMLTTHTPDNLKVELKLRKIDYLFNRYIFKYPYFTSLGK